MCVCVCVGGEERVGVIVPMPSHPPCLVQNLHLLGATAIDDKLQEVRTALKLVMLHFLLPVLWHFSLECSREH